MKRLFAIIILIVTSFSIISCKSSLERSTTTHKQNTRVTSSCTEYDINGNEISKMVYTYDSKGNLINENHYSKDFFIQVAYIYNNKGQLVEKEENTTLGEITKTYMSKYEYDINSNLKSQTTHNKNGDQVNKITYTYDKLNRIIEIFDEKNDQITTYIYESDNNYSVITKYKYGDQTIENKSVYTLDINQNIIYHATYASNSENTIEQETHTEYNEYNQIISSKTYLYGKLINFIEYEYQDLILLRKSMRDETGIYQIEEYEYNEFGEITIQTIKTKSNIVLNYFVFEYIELPK
mgnify:CR=1 FL=1